MRLLLHAHQRKIATWQEPNPLTGCHGQVIAFGYPASPACLFDFALETHTRLDNVDHPRPLADRMNPRGKAIIVTAAVRCNVECKPAG